MPLGEPDRPSIYFAPFTPRGKTETDPILQCRQFFTVIEKILDLESQREEIELPLYIARAGSHADPGQGNAFLFVPHAVFDTKPSLIFGQERNPDPFSSEGPEGRSGCRYFFAVAVPLLTIENDAGRLSVRLLALTDDYKPITAAYDHTGQRIFSNPRQFKIDPKDVDILVRSKAPKINSLPKRLDIPAFCQAAQEQIQAWKKSHKFTIPRLPTIEKPGQRLEPISSQLETGPSEAKQTIIDLTARIDKLVQRGLAQARNWEGDLYTFSSPDGSISYVFPSKLGKESWLGSAQLYIRIDTGFNTRTSCTAFSLRRNPDGKLEYHFGCYDPAKPTMALIREYNSDGQSFGTYNQPIADIQRGSLAKLPTVGQLPDHINPAAVRQSLYDRLDQIAEKREYRFPQPETAPQISEVTVFPVSERPQDFRKQVEGLAESLGVHPEPAKLAFFTDKTLAINQAIQEVLTKAGFAPVKTADDITIQSVVLLLPENLKNPLLRVRLEYPQGKCRLVLTLIAGKQSQDFNLEVDQLGRMTFINKTGNPDVKAEIPAKRTSSRLMLIAGDSRGKKCVGALEVNPETIKAAYQETV